MKPPILCRLLYAIGTGVLIFATELPAQESQYVVQRSDQAKLDRQTILHIAQDGEGYMWLGSTNGLLRYDGQNIRSFKYDDSQLANSLPSNRVRTLYPDAKGRLWVTVQAGGLSLYDADQQRFRNIKPKGGQAQAIHDFWSIAPASDGRLWISSFNEGKIYRFDEGTEHFESIPIRIEGEPYLEVVDMIESRSGDLWVGTDASGVLWMDAQGRQNRHFKASDGSLPSNDVSLVHEDPAGRIWAGTHSGGLCIFDEQRGQFKAAEGLAAEEPGRFRSIFALCDDGSGRLWVGTDDGLVLYDPDAQRIVEHIRHDPSNVYSLSNNRVRAIYCDAGGIVWVGNYGGGLHKLLPKMPFRSIKPAPGQAKRLQSSVIRAIMSYDEESILIGSPDYGITRLHLGTQEVLQSWTMARGGEYGPSSDEISTFFRDPDGGIWIGSWGGGLDYFDPKSGRFQHFRHEPGNPNSLSDNRVQMIRRDSKGFYWIGTESGLNRFDRRSGHFQRFLHDPQNPNSISGNSVQSLAFLEDKDGTYWVGTWQGLNRFDERSGKFTRYLHQSGNSNSLSADHVTCLHDDGQGYLWIGTFSGGLNRLHKSSGRFEHFAEEDGLPSAVIFAILPGKDGQLWMSTDNGLALLDTKKMIFSIFGEEDGLSSQEFWWGSAHRAADGRLFFGSTSGLSHFHPDSIAIEDSPPAVIISGFKVFDQDISIGRDNYIELDYKDYHFSIEFAALDFTEPHKNRYAYQLDGVDKGWVQAGNRHSVSYTFLKGGHYTFRVKGSNHFGYWNEQPTTLHIYIRPPFWQTAWFRAMLALSLVLLAFGGLHWRTARIRKQNKMLESLVAQRTQQLAQQQEEIVARNQELEQQAQLLKAQNEEISAQKSEILQQSEALAASNQALLALDREKNQLVRIVAHDMKSPLNNVKGFLELSKMMAEGQGELLGILAMMEESVEKLLARIGRILDVKAVESGHLDMSLGQTDLASINQALLQQYGTRAKDKQLSLSLESPEGPLLALADSKYLEQALENLLSNAVKFSPPRTHIRIETRCHGGYWRWAVHDQGPGIGPEDQQRLFGKFQRLSAKPTGGEDSTGLGLSIVKRFIEAMGGRVWCESELGKGATFWVELPRYHAAERPCPPLP